MALYTIGLFPDEKGCHKTSIAGAFERRSAARDEPTSYLHAYGARVTEDVEASVVWSLAVPILTDYFSNILPNWVRILRGKSLQDTYTKKETSYSGEQ